MHKQCINFLNQKQILLYFQLSQKLPSSAPKARISILAVYFFANSHFHNSLSPYTIIQHIHHQASQIWEKKNSGIAVAIRTEAQIGTPPHDYLQAK
jgi:hypothetical protein